MNPTCQIPTPRSLAEMQAMENAHVAPSPARVAPRARESVPPLAKGGQGKEEEEGEPKVMTEVQKSRMRARAWAKERKANKKS